jgi:eukaryotic-like serine/threonine-protein kinase
LLRLGHDMAGELVLASTDGDLSARDTEPLFEPGEIVSGAFAIRELLGRGGMGQVFAADDLVLMRSVAIKAMPLGGNNAGGLLLRREAQALAQVRHPGVVAIYATGVHRGLPYIVMERLYGLTMAELIRTRRARDDRFGVGEALDLLIKVADALAAVHEAGMAHCDLKPDNVMVCGGNRVVLLDLGIMMTEIDVGATRTCGTPLYMAPELIEQNVAAGQAHLVDAYSFGAAAYELLTGVPPFDERDLLTLLERHMLAPAPDVRDLRPDVPARLAAIVGDCLAKDPTDRPPRMDAVRWDLSAIHAAQHPRVPSGRHVLIIDDDPDAIELMAACVHSIDRCIEVRADTSCERALATMRHDPPRLVLLDLRLPGMDGVDFCAQLCGMHLLERCPVVVVTADDDAHTREELQRLGVPRVVAKGVELPRRLAAVVRPLVSRGRSSRLDDR